MTKITRIGNILKGDEVEQDKPRRRQRIADLVALADDTLLVGLPASTIESWEPTAKLRWLKSGNRATLQQMWWSRTNGKTDWRDIEIAKAEPEAD